MHDKPSGRALLDTARRALLDDVVPGLAGQPRYVALMVANAIGIAARELELADRSAAAWAAALGAGRQGTAVETSLELLVEAIRAGRHDADPELYGALNETARIGAAIFKPGG